MANTIGGNNPYISNYNRINRSSQLTMQRIATGSQHPTAAQGASEYAITARLSSNVRTTSRSIQNTQNLGAMIRTAAGATKNTVDTLTQIKEHLINAANDSNNSLDRQAIQKNINQLVRQVDSNAYVQYNGMNLLDASRNTVSVPNDMGGYDNKSTLTFAGIDGYENFTLGDLRSQALGLTDAQGNVTIDATTPEGVEQSLAILDRASTVAGGTLNSLQFMEDYASEGLSFEAALDEATTQGAQLQRLEYQEANYTVMEENQLDAMSKMDDADIARQIANMRSDQILQQLSFFAMNMFNQNRASILTLLP